MSACLVGLHAWRLWSTGDERVCTRCGKTQRRVVDEMFNEAHWRTLRS